MFGFIIFIIVLSFVVRLFSRPFFGYRRSPMFPFGLFGGFSPFGGWGMRMGHHHHHGPMHHMHHHGPHHHMGRGPRW